MPPVPKRPLILYMAKYEACALAVEAAIVSNVKLLKVYGDSALVIHQLRGNGKLETPS